MYTHQKSKGEKNGYAFFDLDRTLIPWDTPLLFCNFVIKRMPLRRLYLLLFIPLCPFVKIVTAPRMKRVFLNFLWGLNEKQLNELALEFVDHHFPQSFHTEIIKLFEEQRKLGKLTVLCSASYEILVQPIAQKLGFDCYFGTRLKINGRLNLFPKTLGNTNKGTHKIQRMLPIFPDGFNPSSGDTLPNSHAYSDNHADVPMLLLCEHASIVNPTTELRDIGEKHGWSVHTPPRPTQGKRNFAIACLKQGMGIFPE
mgnify:CR=1 FL=1